jgi:DNA-binding GntR family transcriptional regulator
VPPGTVGYDRNRGYFVAQMAAEEMRQVYLMRELRERLETKLVASMRSIAAADFYAFAEANRGFHFLLYSQSPMHLVLAELERLWNLAEQYRAVYFYRTEGQQQVIEEHERIIEAVRADDRARCAQILSAHRRVGEEKVCGRPAAEVDA